MGFSVSWINPGRLLRIRANKNFTENNYPELRDQVQKALIEAPDKVDYIFDLSAIPQVASPERTLRFMLEKHGVLRRPKTGRLLICGATEEQQLVFSSVGLALRLEIFFFEDEPAALKFVAEFAP
jgi:hypothetical protein